MKLDIGKILSVAGLVQGLVKKAQSIGGKGLEKHAAVAEAVIESVPLIEALVGRDLVSDELFRQAIDALIVAEAAEVKAAAKVVEARNAVAAVVANIKSMKAAVQ